MLDEGVMSGVLAPLFSDMETSDAVAAEADDVEDEDNAGEVFVTICGGTGEVMASP